MNLFKFFFHAHNEIAENGADKVLSSEEENSSVQKTYVNFPTSRKRALDVPLYAISSGRSMVEMLGVLAIIGVLSVGAIAGYSKAMLKYKLNKQAEAMNMLLNNAMQLSLPISNNGDVLYSELLNKLNLLPDGISADPFNPNMLRDVFGNGIWFFTQSNASYGLGYSFSKDNRNRLAICSNLLNIYKAYHTELYRILSDTYTVNDDDVSVDYFGIFYGDKYCTNNVKCIRNISLNDIETLCQSCSQDADDCRLYVTWK